MTTRVSGALIVLLITAAALAEAAPPSRRSAQVKISVAEGEPVQFFFNPSEMTINKGVNWDAKMDSDADAPGVEFAGAQGVTIQFTAEFDRTAEKGDVYLHDVKPLERLTLVDQKIKRPPLLTFTWGTTSTFKGVLESLSVRYTMFSEDGTPVRASVSATFREAEQATSRKQCSPDSPCASGYECVDSDGDGFGRCVRR
jgi:hypothetical protein